MFILHLSFNCIGFAKGGWFSSEIICYPFFQALVQISGSSSSSWGKRDSLQNQTRNLWILFRLPAESPEMETPFFLCNVYAL
ncbi:hypothetical protein QN277_001103 [Acacia crassicarpa]|uniref:Uncharacterized protein n=1 Tax=Acacia crassicarpa TaxID=499986 RepID=A0AAE1N6R2_9FABA|nr:hypothetical protein QN277_001103 [Acacia crassicarpa]